MLRSGPLEITDLLWSVDAAGARQPVRRCDVEAELVARGQRRAARIVRNVPTSDGVLVADALSLRVHAELQRLSEELQMGRRVAALLGPLVAAMSDDGAVRIVDVGCGLGYLIRWLAATRALGRDVELVGVDSNPVLIGEAARLARLEDLSCRFAHGEAFAPGVAIADGPRTILISSGLLHHLAAEALPAFFAEQARLRVAGFVHWDIAPCLWSTLGAWVFHRARMREAVSRHDGVLSARRAHPAATLLAAAAAGAPGYSSQVLEGPRWQPRALDVLRPIVGTRTG